MINSKYKKQMATILERISAKDYMWRYHHGEAKRNTYQTTERISTNSFRIKWPSGMSIIGSHNMRDISGELLWRDQVVEYIPSNLGKNNGIIYYFICNDCGRRVKYLYFQNYLYSPLCRRCCSLPYRQPTRPERRISRYIRRHPEAAAQIIRSGAISAW
jgi:hypothetical protein